MNKIRQFNIPALENQTNNTKFYTNNTNICLYFDITVI